MLRTLKKPTRWDRFDLLLAKGSKKTIVTVAIDPEAAARTRQAPSKWRRVGIRCTQWGTAGNREQGPFRSAAAGREGIRACGECPTLKLFFFEFV